MKKFYPFILLLLVSAGCSKDFLERYDDRIVGTWNLTDVDRIGGGSTSNLPLREGRFTFEESGSLQYVAGNGNIYTGQWNIDKRWITGDCFTDGDGNTNCNDRQARTLEVSMVDFSTQDVISEYFDEIVFTGSNRFKAYVRSGFRTYVFYFRR
ncbi:MAG TPA: hypothetical protein VFR58_08945 [Flavisolibacter sp.]|nr:hypothetical protein [Flavisolibacter sp.]